MAHNLTETRREWLSELYEANSAPVFKVCHRFLKSPEDAADAAHEVFIRAAASLSEPPTSPQARAWLIRVARNYCIDLVRRRERLGLAMTMLAVTADASDEAVQAVEDRQLLLAVLEQLSVRDRAALWQSAVERRPLAEIARSFDLSYMAAAQLISRARRRALVLATRLAVILSFAWLGGAARRWKLAQRSQQLAAFVVVPALMAAVVVGSSPRMEMRANAAAQAVPGRGVGQASPGITGQLPATGPTAAPSPSAAAVPGSVVVAQTTAVRPPATQATVTPSAPPPAAVDIDHGKGPDWDDTARPHPGRGKALGHGK